MERKPNTASLFKEEDKQNPKGPDYTGLGLIEGKELRLAAWINEAKTSGKKYLSITFEEPRVKQAVEPKASTVDDDDIPF
jgi:uncharacterized protein (DUF736 family)|tara:strand:- start:104 stop:343 length:240 start_codon:yes stop_codon:yes gene_type:complete